MKADRIYILTFGTPDSPDTDFEVRNCAAALHFKYTSRNRRVEWLHVDGKHILRVTAHGASRELLPEAVLQATLQNKKSRTFVWQTNVESGRSYLAPATDS